MATMTQMPTPPPDHGGIRPDRNDRNPTFAVPDDEDWVRELREELQRNMEERLREQEKEIEDEIQVQINGAIKSGKLSAEGRKDQLNRLRYAKEQRLRRMRAMLMEEGEARIREERTLRQWSVDGGFPTGDTEFAEAVKREQQALLDKFAKDGRNSTSSSPTAERQQARSSSPPPGNSVASKPSETIRPSAPRMSPTNSASSAHTQSSQAYQQQERKTSQQFIWKPPVQPSETGHPRKTSISANANAGSSTPQRAGSIADNSARRHIGANATYAQTAAYQSHYQSVQPSVPIPTPSSYSSPYSNIQNKPQPPSPWLAELTTGYFYDDPEEISETEDESGQDSNSDADDDRYSEEEEEDPAPNQTWQGSLRGMPPKSSPRIIQGDRGRGRGRGQGVRPNVPLQHHYEMKHSSSDLRGKYETSQPRAVPSVNVNVHRSTERPVVNENAREEYKSSHPSPQVWKPNPDGHGEGSKPVQARPISSTSVARNQEHAAYGEGTSFGSYGSLGSSSLGYGLPSRRPSNANVIPLPMTPEEREKKDREQAALLEVDKKWEKFDKARGLESQTSPLPPSQPPVSSASRNTIPVPPTSTARQRTPDPPSASPKPGSGSFRDKIWIPKEAQAGTKPLHDRDRERSDSLSASRSPPHSQPQPQLQPQSQPQRYPQSSPQPHPSTYRSRTDSEGNASGNVERYDPQNSGAPQSAAAFVAPPSNIPSQRQTEPIRPSSPKYEDSYSSDEFESDFSYDSQPSAVPMSRQPTEEFLPGPSERDRFMPRNMVDNRSNDNPLTSSKSRDKASTDQAEPSTSQRPSDLERKAEELRQKEEALARRQKEIAEREEALARREEEEERRRINDAKLRELEKKAEEERAKELRRKEEEKARERHREEEEKRQQRMKDEEMARQRQREEDRKKEEERRREEERKREERRREEELAREIEREEERVKREQERKDREEAERLQREEEAKARTEDKLWNAAKERNARQNSFAADRPMSTASFASAASSASFASRASTTSNSSGSSSYSTWSTNSGRSTASSATSASIAPDPIRKASTSSASTAWGASPGGRSSASASTTPKASSTPRSTPTSSFPPKGPGGSSASASAGNASTSYEEWERKQQERMKAQQEQFQRDQMRAEQEKLRASSAASGLSTIMHAWTSYEREWNGLKDKPDGSLTWRSFPWPMMKKPSEPEDLTANGIGALVLSVHHSNEKANRDRLKEQLLRWHPDRFENRWLKKVSDNDQEKVRNGAGQVVRALNELMTRENNLASGGGLF